MPELPEVETVRRGLAPVLRGRRILKLEARRPDLRFPLPERFAERVEGARVLELGRRAKFLTAALSTEETLILHLGMTGRFAIDAEDEDGEARRPGAFTHEAGRSEAHDHVVFHVEGARITYNDARRFGFMEMWPTAEMDFYPRTKGFGPEPLSPDFSAESLAARLEGRNTPIKAALLDQAVVAGLGNIYVCEALWRARISPRRKARTVPGARARRLAPHINDVIAEAIAAGGSSISDFAAADGALGYFQNTHAVYGREGKPCPACDKPVSRITQSGRSSFFCSACQR